MLKTLCGVLILFMVCSCGKKEPDQINRAADKGVKKMSITVTSPAFKEGQSIPSKYTCDGNNISPELEWAGAPANTVCFALVADDPDAPRGTFTHWVLFNLPAVTTKLPEDVPTTPTLSNGAEQGANDAGKIGYTGPCPPSGIHRYYFKIYALDSKLNLKSGIRVHDLTTAMQGHILAEGQLMGTYSRG